MFWLENIFWLALFVVYECLLVPIVYAKTVLTVAWATQGLFLTVWNTVAWVFAGPIYIVIFIISDFYNMFCILLMHEGCRTAQGLQDELPKQEIDINDEVRCYNEAREIAIT